MGTQRFRGSWHNRLVRDCIHEVVYHRKTVGRSIEDEVVSEMLGKIRGWELAAHEYANKNYEAYKQAVRELKIETDKYLLYTGERLGNGM